MSRRSLSSCSMTSNLVMIEITSDTLDVFPWRILRRLNMLMIPVEREGEGGEGGREGREGREGGEKGLGLRS